MLRWCVSFVFLLAVFSTGFCESCLAGRQAWRIGVLAANGVERCLSDWTPTTGYLEERLPDDRFEIVPLAFEDVRRAVEQKTVDFLIVNPQMYVALEYEGRAAALATRSVNVAGVRTSLYGGVIFERAGREGAKSLEDLRGKRFAAVDPDSLGGFLAAAGALARAGLDVDKDFSRLVFTGTHREVVQAVVSGRADAGTVRTGVLEEMYAEGSLKRGTLRTFPSGESGHADADTPHLSRSTPLYPEWPFARLAHVSWESARPVLAALLDMPADSEAARAAGLAGWELARPYSQVYELLTEMRRPPFDAPVQVSLAQAAMQHPETVLGVAATLLALTLLAVYLHRLNTRLHQYRSRLETALSRSEAVNADLERSDEEMRQIFEGSAGGMRVIGADFTVLKVNNAFVELSGFSRDELEGKSCHEAFAGRPCRTQSCTMRRIFAGEERLEMEVEKYRKNGAAVTCVLTATPFRAPDGKLLGIIEDFRDITEKKRSDLALRESESEHRSIFENAPLGMAYFDRNGDLLKCNARFRAIMRIEGVSRPEASCIGRLPDEIHPALVGALAGKPSDFEGEVTLAGNRAAVVRVHLNPVAKDGAPPEMVIATVEDVTMFRQKDVELRNLWKTVEHCHASILITDPAGTILYVNPYFTVNTGYSQSEALGKNPNILKSGMHDDAFYAAMWRTLTANQTWRGELANRKKNGEIYWEDATISPVTDETGKVTHFIAVKEDVTERKRKEAELDQALSEFEIIFNNSAISVVLLKGERRISRVNKRFTELFGYEEDELLGKSMNLVHVDPRVAEQFAKGYYPQLRTGEIVKLEHRYRRRDGQVLWCLVSGKALDPGNLEAGILWAFDDITARKELERIREDVERIMRHDLKAPLNGIINLPGLILEEGGLSISQEEMLDYIAQAGKRMLRQVNESLDLYKMEIGAFTYRPASVNLCYVVERVLRDLEGMVKAKAVEVAVTFEGRKPEPASTLAVLGQEDLCYSMTANIVKNAVEASEHGQTVGIDLARVERKGVLAVTNATPVPAGIAPFFFEKYSTSGKPGGTGLGTYSAKLMAGIQGGSIELFTSEDAGTTVTIRLPLATAA